MSTAAPDQDISQRLAEERHRLRRTQAQVAKIGEVSLATQVAYEQGTRAPSTEYLRRLRSGGFDIWYLLFAESEEELAADALDWELHGRIVAAVFKWCESRDVEIRSDKYGELLRLLYHDYRRKPDRRNVPIDVDRAVRLVA